MSRTITARSTRTASRTRTHPNPPPAQPQSPSPSSHVLASAPQLTQTQTITITQQQTTNLLTLVLRRSSDRIIRNQQIADGSLQVSWDEDVIDNEGMGKKSSKKCCVFRKPKDFDESSDESDWEDPDPGSD